MSNQVESRHFLGVLIFLELHRRVLGGRFGTMPRPLSDYAFSEGGYCLDAPEVLPVGGCRGFYIDAELGGVPHQMLVTRSGEVVV